LLLIFNGYTALPGKKMILESGEADNAVDGTGAVSVDFGRNSVEGSSLAMPVV